MAEEQTVRGPNRYTAMTRGWSYWLSQIWFWVSWAMIIILISFGLFAVLHTAGAFRFADSLVPLINPDFKLNLVTEFLGIFFTVVVLDRLHRLYNRRESKPSRYVAVRSAYVDFNRAVDLWKRMVREGYIPARDAGLLEDPRVGLFDDRLVPIASRLKIDSPSHYGSSQTWRDYLIWQTQVSVNGMIESLQTSGSRMSPDLLFALYHFRHQCFWYFWPYSREAEAIRATAQVPTSGQLDFGDPNTPYKFLESIRRLGSVLAREIPEFKGMEDLPTTMDPNCRWAIDEIMSRGGQQ